MKNLRISYTEAVDCIIKNKNKLRRWFISEVERYLKKNFIVQQ